MVKQDATDAEIVEALKAACAYDFINFITHRKHTRSVQTQKAVAHCA